MTATRLMDLYRADCDNVDISLPWDFECNLKWFKELFFLGVCRTQAEYLWRHRLHPEEHNVEAGFLSLFEY